MNYGNPPSRPLPRPILPRERGVLDRMMDVFVGDGPHQRYALICRQCGGHNGIDGTPRRIRIRLLQLLLLLPVQPS